MAIEKIKILGAVLELPAQYSFYLKSIATYAPAFLGYNNSVLARVDGNGQIQLLTKVLTNFEVQFF